jgi:heme/copper-type cytochrome/quinol oxidase subunit 2
MFSRLNASLAALVAVFSIFFAVALVPATTSAQVDISKYAKCGSNVAEDCDKKASQDVSAGEGKLNKTIAMLINVFSVVVGIVAVIMIIYGGFRFITSGGDANATKNARNTILFAIVGIVVVLISQAIVQFVLLNSVAETPATP